MGDPEHNAAEAAVATAFRRPGSGQGPASDALASWFDGVLVVDADGVVTLLNPTAEQLLGLRSMTTLGRPIDEVPESGELLDALRDELARLDGERPSSRVVEVHREGELDLIYVRVTCRGLHDHAGDVRGAILEMQDVTSGHKTDQLKNQYLSIVAHELRTPLTGIKTFSTMMAKGVLGELSDGQRTVVESIREQSLRLEHQIDKLVNLGHIDSNEYGQDLGSIDLVDLVRQSVAAFEVPAADRSISLDVRVPAGSRVVEGDRADLKRAIQALVENAVKFTGDGGRVVVEVRDVEGGRVQVSVQDDGAGIEPRYHGRIFEKFFQVEDPLTRHHGGSGLGLFFVKSIVEAHGSSVHVDSVIGEGARFTFELSCSRTDADDGPAADPESEDSRDRGSKSTRSVDETSRKPRARDRSRAAKAGTPSGPATASPIPGND